MEVRVLSSAPNTRSTHVDRFVLAEEDEKGSNQQVNRTASVHAGFDGEPMFQRNRRTQDEHDCRWQASTGPGLSDSTTRSEGESSRPHHKKVCTQTTDFLDCFGYKKRRGRFGVIGHVLRPQICTGARPSLCWLTPAWQPIGRAWKVPSEREGTASTDRGECTGRADSLLNGQQL